VPAALYVSGDVRREHLSFPLLRVGRRLHRVAALTLTIESAPGQVTGEFCVVHSDTHVAQSDHDLIEDGSGSGMRHFEL
jgi:hypothetical protein